METFKDIRKLQDDQPSYKEYCIVYRTTLKVKSHSNYCLDACNCTYTLGQPGGVTYVTKCWMASALRIARILTTRLLVRVQPRGSSLFPIYFRLLLKSAVFNYIKHTINEAHR